VPARPTIPANAEETMSAIAATELVQLGYTQIEDLMGGMDAWEASGHRVIGK